MLYLLLAAVESEWTRDRENTSLCTSETCETSVCETIIIFVQIVTGQNTFKLRLRTFRQGIMLRFSKRLFMFWLINIIGDVTAAIFTEKTRALSRPQLKSDFHKIWCLDTLTI